jgi:N-acetylglutamate synthase-like GNAT family acetyltransferase
LTSLHLRAASWRRIIRRAEQVFAQNDEDAFVFISPLTQPANLGRVLRREGYRLYDRMQIRIAARLPHGAAPNIAIERVNQRHLPAWIAVFAAAFTLPPTWMPEVRKRLATLCRDRSTVLYLARKHGSAAGVIAVHRTAKVAGIYCLGTATQFRRQGVARALLARAAPDARRAGAEQVCLQHLLGDQVDAFYERMGFAPLFAREVYVRRLTGRRTPRPE